MTMDYRAMPILKFEIENLRHAVMSHMGVVGSEMGDAIEAQFKKAVDEFPWEATVRRLAFEAMTTAIENHFNYGAGRKAIDKAIDEALASLEKPL